jgi:hypothetical protein
MMSKWLFTKDVIDTHIPSFKRLGLDMIQQYTDQYCLGSVAELAVFCLIKLRHDQLELTEPSSEPGS